MSELLKLWQLKKLSTGEPLNEKQLLPENWGPVFGLHGFKDQIHNLKWLGPEYEDMGWFEVGETLPNPTLSEKDVVWNQAKRLLFESDWTMMPDVPMIASKKIEWIEYRRALREIKLQQGFPSNVIWPDKPK
jgi:hypothetical protein